MTQTTDPTARVDTEPTGEGASGRLRARADRTPMVPPAVRAAIVAEHLGAVSGRDSAWRLALMTAIGVASGVAAAVADSPLIWLAHAVAGGVVLTACIAAEHEALHGSMFGPPALNHVVGAVVGALCWSPYSAYRTYHLRHHQRTHMSGDAEPMVVIRTRLMLVGIVAVSTIGLAIDLWKRLFRSLSARTRPEEARLRRPGLDALSIAASGALCAVLVVSGITWGLTTVALVYAGPLIVFVVLSSLSFLPEHYECAYGPAPVTSTTRTTLSNGAGRFVLWNANLHTAHHLVPSVPCRNLPRLHQLIEDSCDHVATGYLSYYRALWARLGRADLPPAPPWTP